MKNDLIKKANTQNEYTHEQIIELMRCRNDPIYFMKTYMMVQHPVKGAIPFDLFSYQEKAIHAFMEHKDVILKIGRQQGKTTVIAGFLLWFACFQFEKYVLVASKDNDAAMDVLNRIRFGYEELPMWLKPGCIYFNRHEISFDNGSTIKSTATTENTGRGRAVSLLMIDELAFVNQQIQQAMWTSLAPTLSTGGACIISSTPNGDQELFAQLWREAETGNAGAFYPVSAAWWEHPDRGNGDEHCPAAIAYKTQMIAKVGALMFRQEYNSEFLSSDPLFISSLLMSTWKPIEPIFEKDGFKFWQHISPLKRYLIGVDVSEGLGKDYAVIQVFDDKLNHIAQFRENTLNESGLYDKIKELVTYISSIKDMRSGAIAEVLWSYENNACGKVISTLYYNDMKFPETAELVTIGDKLGMNTNAESKKTASKNLRRLLESGLMVPCSGDLIAEFKNYTEKSQGIYHAKSGATDDLISATLIISRIFEYMTTYDDEAFDRLYKSKQLAPGIEEEAVNVPDTIEPMPMSFGHSGSSDMMDGIGF